MKHTATNEYGIRLDRNGYAPSIMQDDLEECFLCGNRSDKLDRHEVFSGPNRIKSKSLGCWCMLCHATCHQGFDGVHNNANRGYMLKRKAQRIAMNHYGWSTDEFIRRFGKNYVD